MRIIIYLLSLLLLRRCFFLQSRTTVSDNSNFMHTYCVCAFVQVKYARARSRARRRLTTQSSVHTKLFIVSRVTRSLMPRYYSLSFLLLSSVFHFVLCACCIFTRFLLFCAHIVACYYRYGGFSVTNIVFLLSVLTVMCAGCRTSDGHFHRLP